MDCPEPAGACCVCADDMAQAASSKKGPRQSAIQIQSGQEVGQQQKAKLNSSSFTRR